MKKIFIISIMFFLFSICYAKMPESIDFLVTSDLGKFYFPLGEKDDKIISDFEKKITKLANQNKNIISFDVGRFVQSPLIVLETSYSANPIQLFKKNNFQAINISVTDLVLPEEKFIEFKNFLNTDGSNIFLSNVKSTQGLSTVWSFSKIIEKDDLKIGVIGLTDINLFPYVPSLTNNFKTDPVNVFIKTMLNGLKDKTKINILLSDLPYKDNEKIADEINGIDILFCRDYDFKCLKEPIRRIKNTYLIPVSLSPDFSYINVKINQNGLIDKIIINKKYLPTDSKIKTSLKKNSGEKPIIGEALKDKDFLSKIDIPLDHFEENKFRGEIPGVVRANKVITYYTVFDKKGKKAGNAFYILIHMPSSFDSFYFIILVDNENKIKTFYSVSPLFYGLKETNLKDVLKVYIGKDLKNLNIDKSKYVGIEDNLYWIEKVFEYALKANQTVEGNN